MLSWQDPVEHLERSLAKLKSNGKLCLIEEDPNVLLRAKKSAMAAGCTLVAQPELLPDHFVSILCKP